MEQTSQRGIKNENIISINGVKRTILLSIFMHTPQLSAKSDLYVYFYFHGLSLLNPKGTFCSITSNSWLDVGYGAKLQEFLLTQCHLKLVLDNSAKRSFSSADVNTVICLISVPEGGSRYIVRFVNFTVPFEVILDAVIFYEIETTKRRVSTQEHRVNPFLQKQLLASGKDEKTKYIGDKWCGKYLRAPDIYWYLLEKVMDKLVYVRDVANVRMGLKTGANNFFILDKETISAWNIETKFLCPILSSPKNTQSLQIFPRQLPHQLFMCSLREHALRGTTSLAYIKWGETHNYHKRPSCKTRQQWYNVGERPIPHLNFQCVIGSTARTFYNHEECYALDKFAEVHTLSEFKLPLCLSLNSTFFQLIVNVNGRSNLGGGALVIKIYELEDLLCVNPKLIPSDEIDLTLLKSENWDVLDPSLERRYIDDIIFDILELTQGERDGVYEAVTKLVTTRLKKAKT